MTLNLRPCPPAPKSAAAGAIAAAVLLCSSPAQALTIVQQTGPYTVSASVRVTTDNGVERASSGSEEASRTFTPFNTSLGVLQSATVVLDSRLTATGAVTGYVDTIFSTQTARGAGFGHATFSGWGFSQSRPPLTHSASCQAVFFSGCVANSAPNSQDFDATVTLPGAALPGYAFFGPVTFEHELFTQAAVSQATSGPSSYESELTWQVNNLSLTYEYLRHAAPSFADGASQMTLNLDFGSILQGGPDAALGFSVFDNSADPLQSVGFLLIEADDSGHTSALTTNVPFVRHFTPGASAGFTAFLDSANVGDFRATYAFDVSETSAGVGHSRYRMTLNLRGQVLAPHAAPVPEPAAWATMIMGFGCAGAMLRRRRPPAVIDPASAA